MVYLILEFLSSVFSLESVKACLADQCGGLILPIDGMPIEDKDLIKYKSLIKDKSLKSINSVDLPADFCKKACDLIDEFRRKTVNLEEEWMMYFDYLTGDIIYCWQGEVGESGGGFNREQFRGRHIASLHSPPKGYHSFPSADNFDILENDFEDYEIITSVNTLWIVEFRGAVGETVREKFQFDLGCEIDRICINSLLFFTTDEDINNFRELMVGNYLMDEIDSTINGFDLILVKKEINNDK